MSYEIELTPVFQKEAKRLIKKYASLKNELETLFLELETNPTKGIPLGNNVYKIRIAITSKGKGKSGGARIISLVRVTESEVVLLTIFNKGSRNNISDNEIKRLIKDYL